MAMRLGVLIAAILAMLGVSLAGLIFGLFFFPHAVGCPLEIAMWSLAVLPISLFFVLSKKSGVSVKNALYISLGANLFWPAFGVCILSSSGTQRSNLRIFLKGVHIYFWEQAPLMFVLWVLGFIATVVVIKNLELKIK